MKITTALYALLAASAMAPAAVAQTSSAPAADETAAVADKPEFVESTPLSVPFRLRDNLVTLDVTVKGQRHTAVLDSGAGALVLDQAFAARAGLKPADAVGTAAGAGAEAQQIMPVAVPNLLVGPLRFERLAGYVVNLSQLSSSAGFQVKLLIGAPAFKHNVVRVDYRGQTVTFAPSGSAPRCPAPIPMKIVHDVPVVEVELTPTKTSKPIKLTLVVDLGTRDHGVLLGGAFARSEAGRSLMEAGKPQQVGHGTGGAVQGSVAHVAELRIATGRYLNEEVALTQGVGAFDRGGFDGSLGVPWWKGGSIAFDYQANLLCIERWQ